MDYREWEAQEALRWAVLRGLQAFAVALLLFTLIWVIIK